MSEEAEAYARWESDQARGHAERELEGAGHMAESNARFMNDQQDRILALQVELEVRDERLAVLSGLCPACREPLHEPNEECFWLDLGHCAYAEGTGTCSFGCREEPECQTCRPRGGWPSEHPAVQRMALLDRLRRQRDRKLHFLKVETQRLRRAHRRERERAEQAISFLRVYRQQPGMDWPDVAAFLDADGPF